MRKGDFTVAFECVRFVSIRDCTQSITFTPVVHGHCSFSLLGRSCFGSFGFPGFSAPLTVTMSSSNILNGQTLGLSPLRGTDSLSFLVVVGRVCCRSAVSSLSWFVCLLSI